MSLPSSPHSRACAMALSATARWPADTPRGRRHSPGPRRWRSRRSSWPRSPQCGSPSRTLRSMNAPGRPRRRCTGQISARPRRHAVNSHFIPVGNPPPPRPRSPDFLISSITCWGVISASTFARRRVAVAGRCTLRMLPGSTTPQFRSTDILLQLEEGHITDGSGRPLCRCRSSSCIRSRAALQKMLFNDALSAVRCQFLIKMPSGTTAATGPKLQEPMHPVRTTFTSFARPCRSISLVMVSATSWQPQRRSRRRRRQARETDITCSCRPSRSFSGSISVFAYDFGNLVQLDAPVNISAARDDGRQPARSHASVYFQRELPVGGGCGYPILSSCWNFSSTCLPPRT